MDDRSPGGATQLSHSYAQNHLHAVFSTKDRRDLIPKDLQPKLWAYLAGIGIRLGIHIPAVGGVANHAHVLFQLPADLPLAKAILLLKSNSSKWMNEHQKHFAWQEGYGAFSVSASNLTAVKKYIRNQDAHHKKITFEAEFLALLKKHGVEFDPKYVLG
jgi:REP element-mobilizing transposase RayT